MLVSQSATGYYGPQGDQPLDESAPAGSDFLAEVVVAWEYEAHQADAKLRVALTRTGVVLSSSGGALAKMLPPFKLGVGGPVAGGHQYVPWIHLDDVVGALLYAVDNDAVSGPINVTAPIRRPTRSSRRCSAGCCTGRRCSPSRGLRCRLLYGEMAEMVTTGQRARPAQLQQLGYQFAHPELEEALRDVLGS